MKNKSLVVNLLQNELVLLGLMILFMNFFGLTAIGNTVFLVMITGLLAFKSNFKGKFSNYVFLIIIGILGSMISSEMYRSQSYLETLRASAPILSILIYFFFCKIGISTTKIEKIIYYLIIVFIVCYFIQLLIYPIIIFDAARVVVNEAAGKRISLIGQGLATLGVLFGLNKFLVTKKNKYLLITISCFFINFSNGYRTMVLVSFLFCVFLVVRLLGFSRKLISHSILFISIITALLFTTPVSGILEKMQQRNTDQNFNNPNYIRMVNLNFHETEYFKKPLERFLGSGLPFKGSRYADYLDELDKLGYWYQDWGLIGLSWLVGVAPVIAMVLMSIKASTIKVAPGFYYAGMWILSLVFSSITTHEFYTNGNFVIFSLLFVLIEKEHTQYKINVKLKAHDVPRLSHNGS